MLVILTPAIKANLTLMQKNIVVSLILFLLTCGIYGVFWKVSLVDEINAIDPQEDDLGGWMVVLLTLLTCGIYGLFWEYKAAKPLAKVNGGSDNGVLFIVLSIFSFGLVNFCIMQNDLNCYYANR